eukprot:scaffold7054_cov400-Pinguiococcus_pyrenoidosus.AAC.4
MSRSLRAPNVAKFAPIKLHQCEVKTSSSAPREPTMSDTEHEPQAGDPVVWKACPSKGECFYLFGLLLPTTGERATALFIASSGISASPTTAAVDGRFEITQSIEPCGLLRTFNKGVLENLLRPEQARPSQSVRTSWENLVTNLERLSEIYKSACLGNCDPHPPGKTDPFMCGEHQILPWVPRSNLEEENRRLKRELLEVKGQLDAFEKHRQNSQRARKAQETHFGDNISHESVPLLGDLKKHLESVLEKLTDPLVELDTASLVITSTSIRAFAQYVGWFIEGNIAQLADWFGVGIDRRAFLLRHFMRNFFHTFKTSYESKSGGELWPHLQDLARRGYAWSPGSLTKAHFNEIERLATQCWFDECLPDGLAVDLLKSLAPMFVSEDLDVDKSDPPPYCSSGDTDLFRLLKEIPSALNNAPATRYLNRPERREQKLGGFSWQLLPDIVPRRESNTFEAPAIFISKGAEGEVRKALTDLQTQFAEGGEPEMRRGEKGDGAVGGVGSTSAANDENTVAQMQAADTKADEQDGRQDSLSKSPGENLAPEEKTGQGLNEADLGHENYPQPEAGDPGPTPGPDESKRATQPGSTESNGDGLCAAGKTTPSEESPQREAGDPGPTPGPDESKKATQPGSTESNGDGLRAAGKTTPSEESPQPEAGDPGPTPGPDESKKAAQPGDEPLPAGPEGMVENGDHTKDVAEVKTGVHREGSGSQVTNHSGQNHEDLKDLVSDLLPL